LQRNCSQQLDLVLCEFEDYKNELVRIVANIIINFVKFVISFKNFKRSSHELFSIHAGARTVTGSDVSDRLQQQERTTFAVVDE